MKLKLKEDPKEWFKFTAVMALSRGRISGRAFASVPPAAEWLAQAAFEKNVRDMPRPGEIGAMLQVLRGLPSGPPPPSC